MTEPLLLTEEQAAERLQMHPRTLRKLRQTGQIRYVRPTERMIRYRPEDCAAFIERQAVVETPVELGQLRPRGRARPQRKDSGNVLSFTARRQARRQGLGG
jgi:hypothetical protein